MAGFDPSGANQGFKSCGMGLGCPGFSMEWCVLTSYLAPIFGTRDVSIHYDWVAGMMVG